MQLTRAGEYAIRCILYLSTQEAGLVIKRRAIAEAMDIPNHFLGKIAQLLDRAGIIEITQGAKGGYRLLNPPRDVSMLDVIEAVEGTISLNKCLIRPESCGRSYMCPVHRVWHQARESMTQVLSQSNFADLAKHEQQCIDSPTTANFS